MKTDPRDIKISEYTYNLPNDRIAKYPIEPRDRAKLLIYRQGNIYHVQFKDLAKELNQTLLVVNNTKVIYARLLFQKKTGAKIEIFCLNPVNPSDYNLAFQARGKAIWSCMIGNLKKWKSTDLERVFVYNNKQYILKAQYIGSCSEDNTHNVSFEWDGELSFSQVLDSVGLVPIPPYLNRETKLEDRYYYQTMYSKLEGSVAAPTAGLHFTREVIDSLKEKGINWAEITLHVGAGTFRPVKSQTIGGHAMHTEYFTIRLEELKKMRQNLETITAVGTTTMRTLESLYWLGVKMIQRQNYNLISQWMPYDNSVDYSTEQVLDYIIKKLDKSGEQQVEGWTQIIIVPGYKFRVVNNLITNFHQPQSTLLLLVAAFVGEDWRKIYTYALENNFRFLSYGDASLLLGEKNN